MIRVLHLIDEGRADFQTTRAVRSLGEQPGEGTTAAVRAIRAGGGVGRLASTVLALRREARPFDVAHAWGMRALAASALGTGRPIVFSPGGGAGLRLRDVRWLRAVMGYRDVQVVCPTSTGRRMLVERGVPIERCHLIRPGVEFARVRRRRDAALRRSLGLSDEDYVLLAPGESTRAAGHDLAAHAASILHVLDGRYKLLLWGRGERLRRAAAIGPLFRQPDLVRVAEQRLGRRMDFEELLPAADAVLVTALGAVATLPVAICMAAGLPIVSTVTYTVAELLEDRHNALMVPQPKPRLLAQRVLELRQDAQLQWHIADVARTEAYEYFAQTRFMNQFRSLYRQVAAGERVEVVEPAPGAGLRFHGRG
jgi:glycosyltransferase involved in cell wall biosynthesis